LLASRRDHDIQEDFGFRRFIPAKSKNIYAALGAGEIDAGALPIDLRFAGQRQYGWNAFEAASDVPSVLATTRS
jgi:hypothetical protein